MKARLESFYAHRNVKIDPPLRTFMLTGERSIASDVTRAVTVDIGPKIVPNQVDPLRMSGLRIIT